MSAQGLLPVLIMSMEGHLEFVPFDITKDTDSPEYIAISLYRISSPTGWGYLPKT